MLTDIKQATIFQPHFYQHGKFALENNMPYRGWGYYYVLSMAKNPHH
jgi:hypothetical protein